MCVVIKQSSPLPISIFLSLCLLFPPPYAKTSDQLAYMQTCVVCMYVCVHIGVHYCQDGVLLRGRNTDGNPAWVCRTETPRMGLSRVLLLPSWDQGDLSNRSPICRGVHVYVFTHVHTWVYLYACVWVWTVKIYRYRGSQGWKKNKKRSQDRYSEMDVCT